MLQVRSSVSPQDPLLGLLLDYKAVLKMFFDMSRRSRKSPEQKSGLRSPLWHLQHTCLLSTEPCLVHSGQCWACRPQPWWPGRRGIKNAQKMYHSSQCYLFLFTFFFFLTRLLEDSILQISLSQRGVKDWRCLWHRGPGRCLRIRAPCPRVSKSVHQAQQGK